MTQEFEGGEVEEITLPCLVNPMTQRKQFEEYGSRNLEIISVRFVSEVPEFDKAIYDGDVYKLFEENFVPDKKAVRMQKVVE